MKPKNLLLAVSLTAASLINAQDNTKSFAPVRSLSYAGAGLFLPSSGMKTNSMVGSGINFTAGHFHAFTKNKTGLRFGMEVKFNYSIFDKDLNPPLFTQAIKYDNGSGVATRLTLNYETLKKDPDAYHYLVGPAAILNRDRFYLQPSLLVGYASVSQESFRFYDRLWPATDPANDTLINFYSAGHETNNGFVVVPAIKAGYRFLPKLSAFLSVEYSIGSKQEFTDQVYKPLPGPDPQSVYDYYQITHGSYETMTREGKLRALMVNLNIAFSITD